MSALVSLVVLVSWNYLVHVSMDEVFQEIRCSRPLPGPDFPWNRCAGHCRWCDYIQAYEREEPPPHSGPYR